jgi:hypothetical protein
VAPSWRALCAARPAIPIRTCARTCEKELGDLEDREIQCRTEHCPGTFTWSKEQQLAAGVRPKLKEPEAAHGEPGAGEAPTAEALAPTPEAEAAATQNEPTAGEAPAAVAAEKLPAEGKGKRNKRKRRREVQPPERRCPACAEFLANRKTQEIPCMQCGTPIFWPPESQLQTHLGNWAAPSICGACKLIQVTAARDAAREILRHQHPGPVEQPPAAAETPTPAEAPTPEPPTEG